MPEIISSNRESHVLCLGREAQGRHIGSAVSFLMRAFASEYPEAARIVLYGGDHPQTIAGIQLFPIVKALPILERIIWPG